MEMKGVVLCAVASMVPSGDHANPATFPVGGVAGAVRCVNVVPLME